jgi:hypothetical protein
VHEPTLIGLCCNGQTCSSLTGRTSGLPYVQSRLHLALYAVSFHYVLCYFIIPIFKFFVVGGLDP